MINMLGAGGREVGTGVDLASSKYHRASARTVGSGFDHSSKSDVLFPSRTQNQGKAFPQVLPGINR